MTKGNYKQVRKSFERRRVKENNQQLWKTKKYIPEKNVRRGEPNLLSSDAWYTLTCFRVGFLLHCT